MKHNNLLPTLLVADACTMEGTTAQQFQKLQAKTDDPTQDLQDYAFAQKYEYTRKMRRQLVVISQELDQLAAKIEKSNDAAKPETHPQLRVLRARADQLKKLLGEAGNATESTWDGAKLGSMKAYGELKEGFSKARQWVSEKNRTVRVGVVLERVRTAVNVVKQTEIKNEK